MTGDWFSITISILLMLFFMGFGYWMTQVKGGACPWEEGEEAANAPERLPQRTPAPAAKVREARQSANLGGHHPQAA